MATLVQLIARRTNREIYVSAFGRLSVSRVFHHSYVARLLHRQKNLYPNGFELGRGSSISNEVTINAAVLPCPATAR